MYRYALSTVYEEATEDVAALSIVTDSDIKSELKASKTSAVWGTSVDISGDIYKGSDKLSEWHYVWKDKDGAAVTTNGYSTSMVSSASAMSLILPKDYAGQTLTLWIYRDDPAASFNINTGIAVTVEKKEISAVTLKSGTTLTYNGYTQSLSAKDIDRVVAGTDVLTIDDYDVNSTSSKDAGTKVTLTVTAKDTSAFKGSKEKSVSIDKKTYSTSDQDKIFKATI